MYTNSLAASFWHALKTQALYRNSPLTEFKREVAGCLLVAGHKALQDHNSGIARYQVVSAPTGSGKSSFAFALIKGLVDALPGSSAVFLCETIAQCEDTYRELVKLITPNAAAVWTTAHDRSRRPEDVETEVGFRPSAQFEVDDLQQYPVIVVTHAFYKGPRGSKARVYGASKRTLTIVDERPEEVSVYDIDLGDVSKARDCAATEYGGHSAAVDAVRDLYNFLDEAWEQERTSRKSFRALHRSAAGWFTSREAEGVLITNSDSSLGRVIGFVQALHFGYAFMSRFSGVRKGGRFVGYSMDLPIEPGTILLDATSDIDGVTDLTSWRMPVASPKASYENLLITHITIPPSVLGNNNRVSEAIRSKECARAYAGWIKSTVTTNTASGDKVLVVVHKAMIDGGFLPDCKDLNENAFDLDGRDVAWINWGYGIGSNRWRKATSVFLFGEFHLPKRILMGQMLGLRNERVTEYRLSQLQSPKLTDDDLRVVRYGHLLRWEKQLAMRGNARNLTPTGACGHQKLFVTSDFARTLMHREVLFPGAKFSIARSDDGPTLCGTEALARFLLTSMDRRTITSSAIRDEIGVDIGKHGTRLRKNGLVQEAELLGGWVYVPGRGRGSLSRFERMSHPSECDHK